MIVPAVLADCLYGNADFISPVNKIFAESQAISQLQHNQKVYFRGRTWHLDEYFKAYPGVSMKVSVRGFETKEAIVSSARRHKEAHERKRFIVAIHYANETDFEVQVFLRKT